MKPHQNRRIAACCMITWAFFILTAPLAMAQTTPPGPAGGKPSTADAKPGQPPAPQEQFVSIDFNNVDINVFIKFISELTGKNFVIDQRVKGKVTIISPAKISVTQAYQVFESVLEVHGYTSIQAGEIIKIVPSPDARSRNIETLLREEATSPDDRVITQIIPLTYADSNEIKRLFAPLISKSSIMLAYPATNMLIVTDVASNIRRLLRILKAIDVTGIGRELTIIPLEHADASNMAKLLGTIFQPARRAPKEKQVEETELPVLFVADERTNTVILLASEIDTARIKQLIRMLDKEMPKGKERFRVYYLEHATAEDLAKVLLAIPTKTAAPAKGAKTEAPILSAHVQITADKATNSLIIMAEKDDFPVLEEIIKKLDIPRAMVYIEALIMEVNLDKEFRIGTEWIVGGKTTIDNKGGAVVGKFSDGPYNPVDPASATPPASTLPPGFALGVFGPGGPELTIGGATVVFPNIGAIIRAFKSDNDVQILSTPQVLTTDNEEATITVATNIPFQTRSAAESGVDTYSSFEYRDVGKTLKITPQISKDRMVRLKIALEVSDVVSAGDGRPTTLKRSVDTTVIVLDGNTLVIGGLIDQKFDATETRVPCLGDIPGAGWLFKTLSQTNNRTNLYVFLTPRVVQNPQEATEIYTRKKEDIDSLKGGQIKLYNQNPGEEKKQ